uniref:Tribbles-like protein 2 n=1 Tax=Scolopendra viridis TaxID=118503 RepID=A0A4D5R9F4_SCOVI
MNCVIYSSLSDSNHEHDGELKQQQACFEPPPPPDLAFVRTVPGLNPDLQPSANVTLPETRSPQPTLRIGKYLILDQLHGSTLYKSLNIQTQEEFVCKIVNNIDSHQIFAAHYRLDSHDHINEIQEVLIGETKTYIFFPPSYGDLHSYMRTRRRLRESEAQRLFAQVAAAVAHCHENRVVLRDLKLRKFVFKDPERTQLKLESLEDAVILDDDDDSLCDKHGCPAYVSPEILTSSNQYSGCAADMWSMGVMLYTILVGRYPFHDSEPSLLFAKIRRSCLAVPDWLSSRARCLIRGLLRPNPTERLTAADALFHPWLQSELPDIPFKLESKLPDQTVPTGAMLQPPEPSNIHCFK